MLKIVDRSLGWLLLLGGVGHTYGAFQAYAHQSQTFIWAMSGSLAVLLLAVVNLVRVERSDDRTLAWLSFAGCVCWIVLTLGFGKATRDFLDPRVIYHVVVSLGLAVLSLRMAFGWGAGRDTMVAGHAA